MGISVNGPSGIDTKSLIDQLVALEQQKVTKVQRQKSAYQVKINAYTQLNSILTDFKTKSSSFSQSSTFDLFKTASSNSNVVTVTGGPGSIDSQFDVNVFQVATNEKMISKDGKITSQTATFKDLNITTGDINVGGAKITIADTDTIQDLRSKINSAVDSSGNKIGVTASVVKIADANYRLVLTAKDTGATGITYKDETGSVLQDLGIIQNAAGDKGNTTQKLTSADSIQAAFDSLALGESISYGGTDRDGHAVSNVFMKTASSSIDDFVNQVKSTYHGTADVSIDTASGSLMINDKTAGSSKITMSSLSFGSTAHTVNVSEYGKQGTGVLSVGRDAFFSVEQISMQSSSNTASGFIAGATFQLNGVSDPGETVNVSLNRDLDAIKQKFQDLVNCFNNLSQFAQNKTKFADPNDSTTQDGDLAGDMTVDSVVTQVRSVFQQQNTLFGNSGYTSLTMIGLKTDPQTGQFSIDDTMFNKAITANYDQVMRLFTSVGVSDNNSVQMGRNTADTSSGNYDLQESDPDHVQISLKGKNDWYTSDLRIGDIVSFTNGPANGLALTIPSGSLNGTTASFTYSKGLGKSLEEILNKMTDSHDGLVEMRQESMQTSMKNCDDQVSSLQDRVNRYRDRLTKQFSAMEQALSNLQNQYSKMANSLSSSSS